MPLDGPTPPRNAHAPAPSGPAPLDLRVPSAPGPALTEEAAQGGGDVGLAVTLSAVGNLIIGSEEPLDHGCRSAALSAL